VGLLPLGYLESRLVDYVARLAAGLEDPEGFRPRILSAAYTEAVVNVAMRVAEPRGGVLYCQLCGRGPYTRRGIYLHLKRVHASEIVELVRDEVRRIESYAKRRGRA
jgi:hypothetical protein